ncbi:MAG: hypothetical protein ACWGQW_00555 [bacterium]
MSLEWNEHKKVLAVAVNKRVVELGIMQESRYFGVDVLMQLPMPSLERAYAIMYREDRDGRTRDNPEGSDDYRNETDQV